MTTTFKRFDIKDFTGLPVSMHMKLASPGGVIRVITPHKGEGLLDWRSSGLFAVHDVLAGKIVENVRKLEHESREYLFKQWLSSLTP